MPALIISRVQAEDQFEEMMLVDSTAEEAAQAISDYITENRGTEIEIAAGQMIHIGISADGASFDVRDIDKATADFMLDVMGGDFFGTGILASHIFTE